MKEGMKKGLAAAITALMLLGPRAVFAQPAPEPGPGMERGMPDESPLAASDMMALTEARIAGLRAGLELTPGQEQHWTAVEQALRSMESTGFARRARMREVIGSEDGIAVLRARAEAMEQRAAELRKLAAAAEPLYRSLSGEQRHRLHFLVRMMMHRRQPHSPGRW
jgi:zinc resistance-associated protein